MSSANSRQWSSIAHTVCPINYNIVRSPVVWVSRFRSPCSWWSRAWWLGLLARRRLDFWRTFHRFRHHHRRRTLRNRRRCGALFPLDEYRIRSSVSVESLAGSSWATSTTTPACLPVCSTTSKSLDARSTGARTGWFGSLTWYVCRCTFPDATTSFCIIIYSSVSQTMGRRDNWNLNKKCYTIS